MSAYSAAVLAETGLLAYYRLADGVGTSGHPADSSGNGHNGDSINGSPTFGVPGLISGDANTALHFNTNVTDSARYKTYATGFLLGGNPNFSIELWVKGTTTGGPVLALYGEYESNAHAAIAIQTVTNAHTGFSFLYQGEGVAAVSAFSGAVTLADGNPHQIVCTKAGTAGIVYIDGLASGSGATFNNSDLWTANSLARIESGNWFDNSGFGLAGYTLDEVSLYTTTLAPAQVLNHWQLGAGIAASGTQLVAHSIGRLNR